MDAILEAGIRRVVVGSADPNPLVAGKGIRILREHGIEVTEHMLEEECDRLNEVFFHYIQTKRPFVVMKYAMTMDGKIATYTGASKWIIGNGKSDMCKSKRHKYTAIMVGVGTVADNPMLNCRMEGGKNPIRIIYDATPSHTVGYANCCNGEGNTDHPLRPAVRMGKTGRYLAAGCQITGERKKRAC